MAFSVKIEQNDFRLAGTRTRQLLQLVVDKAAADIEAIAKTMAPVAEIAGGTLRNSIQAEKVGPLAAEVRVGASYGEFVELGTWKMAARPYLGPASESVRPAFNAAVRQAVKKGTGG